MQRPRSLCTGSVDSFECSREPTKWHSSSHRTQVVKIHVTGGTFLFSLTRLLLVFLEYVLILKGSFQVCRGWVCKGFSKAIGHLMWQYKMFFFTMYYVFIILDVILGQSPVENILIYSWQTWCRNMNTWHLHTPLYVCCIVLLLSSVVDLMVKHYSYKWYTLFLKQFPICTFK